MFVNYFRQIIRGEGLDQSNGWIRNSSGLNYEIGSKDRWNQSLVMCSVIAPLLRKWFLIVRAIEVEV
jgi:hypothetical protein